MKHSILAFAMLSIFLACEQTGEYADKVFINGHVYTVDTLMPRAQAIAVKDGKILKVGSNEDVAPLRSEATEVIDLKGAFAMPGFIEGHGHFSGMGSSLLNLNFLKSRTWDEIVEQVRQAAENAKPGEWIYGRGWHQEKWVEAPEKTYNGYPYHHQLSDAAPNNPVLLRHASGHGLMANEAAMEAAGINLETPDPKGGRIVRDASGEAIGVFEERAMAMINRALQAYLDSLPQEERIARWYRGIELAQQKCLANGITSFQDAGSSFEEIERYGQLAEEGKFNIRLWAMVRHSSDRLRNQLDGFPIINAGNNFFTCRAIKTELDGALGSYGAWLLAPYADNPGFAGQNTTPIEEVEAIAAIALEHNMQLCVHTIGDRANRELLNIMERLTQQEGKNLQELRWRSEHAQHIDPADIPRFAQLGVIASMQGIHCTSDAPFVVKRLGEQRARTGAYPWRSLLDAGAIVTNGTDVPVEDINPLECFYASVTRRRHQEPEKGLEFFPEQKMTREQAIKSYTLSNAWAAFEDTWKGSLSPGKVADIVVLSNDLTTCPDEDILTTKVLMTFVNGELKYQAEDSAQR